MIANWPLKKKMGGLQYRTEIIFTAKNITPFTTQLAIFAAKELCGEFEAKPVTSN